jgi:hypothetical protein
LLAHVFLISSRTDRPVNRTNVPSLLRKLNTSSDALAPLWKFHAARSSKNSASSGDLRAISFGFTTTFPLELTVLTLHSTIDRRRSAESTSCSAARPLPSSRGFNHDSEIVHPCAVVLTAWRTVCKLADSTRGLDIDGLELLRLITPTFRPRSHPQVGQDSLTYGQLDCRSRSVVFQSSELVRLQRARHPRCGYEGRSFWHTSGAQLP